MHHKSSFLWMFLLCDSLFFSAGENAPLREQKIIKAESGQMVTLPCRALDSNKPIIVVEWSRPDQEPEYVLLYRDEHFVPDEQNPSFANRVDLQDRQMKDGDVSLILKNVTPADNGTYECRVVMRETNRRKRAHLKTEPISIIQLSVGPPGPPGGQEQNEKKEDGGKEDGVSRGHVGLLAGLSVVMLGVLAAVIGIKRKKNSPLPLPPDEEADQQLV